MSKVVDPLMRLQMEVVEDVVDLVSLDPQDVPIVRLDFFVPLLAESV